MRNSQSPNPATFTQHVNQDIQQPLKRISVVLVDDQHSKSKDVQDFLTSFPDIYLVAVVNSAEAALEGLEVWKPQVVLMDMLMPGGMDGTAATKLVKERFPEVNVIALTSPTDEGKLLGVIRAGASGYVRKDSQPEALLMVIRAAASSGSFIHQPLPSAAIPKGVPAEDLSPRETDVLLQMAFGRSNKDIAEALTISEETVKSHVGNLLAKLHLENRTQAVVYALKRGLVSLEELG